MSSNRSNPNRGKRRLTWAIALLLLAPAAPAHSQTEANTLRITGIDLGLFPEVRLHATILDIASDPIDIVASSLTVSEDGVPFPVTSVTPIDAGVRLFFVIEPGDGYGSTGIRFATVVSSAVENIEWFVSGRPWMTSGTDEVGVLVQEGRTANILVPFTSDAAAANEVESSRPTPPPSG